MHPNGPMDCALPQPLRPTSPRRRVSVVAVAGALLAMLAIGRSVGAVVPPSTQPALNPAAQPMWVKQVEPILNKSCFSCHGAQKQKGGLDLRQPQAILEGGTDGSAVIAGRPEESPLYQRIQPGSEDHMPPDKDHQLTAEELSIIQRWIATLPPPNHPASTGGINWGETAPSLMSMATSTKWQPPAGLSPSAAIDFAIQKHWAEQKITGNGVCDDRVFVRRVYLDLVGRIPTLAEAESFVKSTAPEKRATLVDRLLSDPAYAQHMADVFDVVLMERKGPGAENERRGRGWIEFLKSSFGTNRPWNDVVNDLVSGRPKSPQQKGAVWFLYERRNNYQQMAEAVAPVAFGVSIGCAQCHDHPLSHEIKQQHYWGLVAAFNRTGNADTKDGVALSESATGGFVSFTNLKKESQPAIIALLNDKTIAEQRPAEGVKEVDAADKYIVAPGPPATGKKAVLRVAAVPKFSRRQAVADAVTHDNPLLARAFVNRMWALLLGRGFTNPVDQMDSRHLPSHPELLAWLSADFERNGYDVKRLIRTIVLSQTYQLDSEWNGSTPPVPELFARGLEKPLSAEALCQSLRVATGHDQAGGEGDNDDIEALRRATIVAFPTLFPVEYNATLQQAMFLTNSPLLDNLLKPAGQNLTARLVAMQTNPERARTIFLEVLGRLPDKAEQAQAVAYLDSRSERPEAAVRQLVWAILTSTEFQMNH